MNKKYTKDQEIDEDGWDIEDESSNWYFAMIPNLISDSISLYALKEIGYYMGLFLFSLVGFGILNYYNVQHDLKTEELERKSKEEAKNINHNNFKNKTD